MNKIIDLHIHTNLSDGTLTPKQIIDEAVKNNVNIISIADHDNIDAYTKELYMYAKENKINLINGVEISTKTNKCGIHVLGYNFDINNKEFKNKLEQIRNSRHIYLHDVSEKLTKLGYIINKSELDKIKSVTKAHIALDIINNEQNKEILLKNFNHIPKKGEFIETIMNEGCPGYIKKQTVTPKEASDMIRKAGGIVILAHPVAYSHEDNLSDSEIISIAKEMNADGIEANYIYIDRNNNQIDECGKWNKIAQKNKLITTIGSDFHYIDGIHPTIGLTNVNIKSKKKINYFN